MALPFKYDMLDHQTPVQQVVKVEGIYPGAEFKVPVGWRILHVLSTFTGDGSSDMYAVLEKCIPMGEALKELQQQMNDELDTAMQKLAAETERQRIEEARKLEMDQEFYKTVSTLRPGSEVWWYNFGTYAHADDIGSHLYSCKVYFIIYTTKDISVAGNEDAVMPGGEICIASTTNRGLIRGKFYRTRNECIASHQQEHADNVFKAAKRIAEENEKRALQRIEEAKRVLSELEKTQGVK